MIGRGGWAARLGLQIHEHQIGDGAVPIGEMRKVQDRLPASASPAHRQDRQRGEETIAGIQLQRHAGELSHSRRGAAHRSDEAGRIGAGEHLPDKAGHLSVGLQRDLHFLKCHTPLHQSATHHGRFRFPVVDGHPGVDASLTPPHRENGVP